MHETGLRKVTAALNLNKYYDNFYFIYFILLWLMGSNKDLNLLNDLCTTCIRA